MAAPGVGLVTGLEPRHRTALGIMIAGLGVGVLGDQLLMVMPWGINVPIVALILLAAGYGLAREAERPPTADAPWLALTTALCAVAYARRDSIALRTLDLGALIIALAATTLATRGISIRQRGISAYVVATVQSIAHAWFGWIPLLGQVPWRVLTPRVSNPRVRAVIVGLVLATPLLIVFGALFVSADQQFETLVSSLFQFDLGPFVRHAFFTGFWGALAAGTLWSGLLSQSRVDRIAEEARSPELRATSGITVLAALNLLFVVFVALQLRWLFGGPAVVEQTTGLTVSAYARRGFFELVTAAGLTLPVLLAGDWMTRTETPQERKSFRALMLLTIMLVGVMMASALQRMLLYVSAFGLTELRLYPTAFMVWLAGVLGWFAWTVLRGARPNFAFGALVQAGVVLAGLHLVNPDALIVRTNLALSERGVREFDIRYPARELSADAVPALLKALPQLPRADRAEMACELLQRWGPGEETDWRSWNWSAARARSLVGQQVRGLRLAQHQMPHPTREWTPCEPVD